jgi:hypothetical protein
MLRRLNVLAGAAIAAITPAGTAAEEDRPARTSQAWHTFRAGIGAGIVASDLRIDGKRTSTLGPAFALSGEAAYTRAFVRTVGAVGILSLGTWPDRWSSLAGEERHRVDLAVGGALRLLYGQGSKRARVFGSVTVGPTISWIDAPVHIGISESFSPGMGLNAGFRAGLDLPVTGVHGVFFSIGAVTHATWLSHRAQGLPPDAATAAVEKYRVFDAYCFASTGYVWER